jgi:hypothetical protein
VSATILPPAVLYCRASVYRSQHCVYGFVVQNNMSEFVAGEVKFSLYLQHIELAYSVVVGFTFFSCHTPNSIASPRWIKLYTVAHRNLRLSAALYRLLFPEAEHYSPSFRRVCSIASRLRGAGKFLASSSKCSRSAWTPIELYPRHIFFPFG